MGLIWTEQLSVGNAMIDFDHKTLVGMVNGVERALKGGDHDVLLRAFKLLSDYADVHFAHEEKIAKAVDLPFDQHKRTHKYLLNELQHIKEELEAKAGMWTEGAVEHFCHFLENWLVEHLTGEDAQMKPVLKKYPYGFKPA